MLNSHMVDTVTVVCGRDVCCCCCCCCCRCCSGHLLLAMFHVSAVPEEEVVSYLWILLFGKHPRGADMAGLFEQGTRDLAEFLPACSEPASSPSSSSSSSSSGELRRNFGWESCWKEVITDKGPCYTSSGCITTLCQFDGQKHFVSCTWHFQRLFPTLWRGAAAYTPPRSDFGGSPFGTCTMWG